MFAFDYTHIMPIQSINPEELLHDHGFRITPLRVGLLTLFDSQKNPLSIADITKKMKRYRADTTTLYRAVEAFVEAGFIRKLSFSTTRTNKTYYDLIKPRQHTHHVLCEYCNTIETILFCNRSLESGAKQNSKLFKTIHAHELSFVGTCKKCARAVR